MEHGLTANTVFVRTQKGTLTWNEGHPNFKEAQKRVLRRDWDWVRAQIPKASREEIHRLLEETDLYGYQILTGKAYAENLGMVDRILKTERQMRKDAAFYEIDLTQYPNADLAERRLA